MRKGALTFSYPNGGLFGLRKTVHLIDATSQIPEDKTFLQRLKQLSKENTFKYSLGSIAREEDAAHPSSGRSTTTVD